MDDATRSPPTPLLVSVQEAVRLTGLGRTTIYAAMANGRLDARHYGGRILITMESIKTFVAGLTPATLTPPAPRAVIKRRAGSPAKAGTTGSATDTVGLWPSPGLGKARSQGVAVGLRLRHPQKKGGAPTLPSDADDDGGAKGE